MCLLMFGKSILERIMMIILIFEKRIQKFYCQIQRYTYISVYSKILQMEPFPYPATVTFFSCIPTAFLRIARSHQMEEQFTLVARAILYSTDAAQPIHMLNQTRDANRIQRLDQVHRIRTISLNAQCH